MAYGKAYGLFYFSKSDGPFVGARVLSLSLEGKGKEILNDLKTLVVMGPTFYITSNYSRDPTKYVDDLVDSESQETAKSTYPTFFAKGSTGMHEKFASWSSDPDAHGQQSHACLAPCCTL